MTRETLLPLFPLEVVLFPGTKLPLHIFEERYKLMVQEVIAHHVAFGVILGKSGKILNIGCTAMVEKVTKRYSDGRFDIDTRGWDRFKTIELDESRPYLQARVEYFEDDSRAPANPQQLQKVKDLAKQLADRAGVEPLDPVDTSLPQPSFHLAHGLPLELEFKQRLLGKRSEAERLADLAEYLPQFIEKVETADRLRRVVGSNGMGRGG